MAALGFPTSKTVLDKLVKLPRWTLHDLRRTAETLTVLEGVRPDIATRVTGRKLSASVMAIYQHDVFAAEKREALEKLAAAVARILEG